MKRHRQCEQKQNKLRKMEMKMDGDDDGDGDSDISHRSHQFSHSNFCYVLEILIFSCLFFSSFRANAISIFCLEDDG